MHGKNEIEKCISLYTESADSKKKIEEEKKLVERTKKKIAKKNNLSARPQYFHSLQFGAMRLLLNLCMLCATQLTFFYYYTISSLL